MAESSYYYRFPENIEDRIDFNYNSPEYEKIEVLLAKSKFKNIVVLENPKYLKRITSGKTPKNLECLDDGGIPFIGGTHVLFGKVELEMAPRISREIHEGKLASSQIKKNDILIVIAGVNVGRCATYNHSEECNANQAVAILTVNEKEIVPQYLTYYLNSQIGQLFFSKLQHISSQPNINLEEIQKIKVILPSGTQQQEIMNDVQKLIDEADRAEKQVQTKLLEVEKVISTELNLIIPKKASYDYYPQFLDNIPDRLDFVFNYPFYDKLDEAKKQASCKFKKLTYPFVDYSEETTNPLERPELAFEYVDIGNIDLKWGLLKSEPMLGKDATSSRVRRVMHRGEILLSTTRPTRKAIAIVPDNLDGQVCSTGFVVIKPQNEIDRNYLFYILRSDFMMYQFERYASGSSYPELSKNDLPAIEVPYIEDEGKRKIFCDRLRTIINEAKSLEEEVQKKAGNAKNLFDRLIFQS